MSASASVTRRASNLIARAPRARFGREGGKIAAGVLLIAAVLFGQDVFGAATASRRLAPALAGATGPSNVVVALDFVPERFHNERLARFGVFSGRDGSVSRIRLRGVSPDSLAKLGRLAWVSRIEPMAPPRPPAARQSAPKGDGKS